MSSKIRFTNMDVSELKDFQKAIEKVGEKAAKKCSRKAALAGANVVLKAIRKNAPSRTGKLKHGFTKTKEHSKLIGKFVYDVRPSKAKNEIFQKPIKNPGVYGGKSQTAYYPSSVEYGFLTADGDGTVSFIHHDKGYNQYIKKQEQSTGVLSSKSQVREHKKSRKVDGQHFIRDAADSVENEVIQTTKDTFFSEVEKAWLSKNNV